MQIDLQAILSEGLKSFNQIYLVIERQKLPNITKPEFRIKASFSSEQEAKSFFKRQTKDADQQLVIYRLTPADLVDILLNSDAVPAIYYSDEWRLR